MDAVRGGRGTIDLRVGEQVTSGLNDLEDFDAARIVRADGSEVIGQPRFGNGRHRPDDRPIEIGNAPSVNIGELQICDDFLVTISPARHHL